MDIAIKHEIMEIIKSGLIDRGISPDKITLQKNSFSIIKIHDDTYITDRFNRHIRALINGTNIKIGLDSLGGWPAITIELADPNAFEKACDHLVELYKANFSDLHKFKENHD